MDYLYVLLQIEYNTVMGVSRKKGFFNTMST